MSAICSSTVVVNRGESAPLRPKLLFHSYQIDESKFRWIWFLGRKCRWIATKYGTSTAWPIQSCIEPPTRMIPRPCLKASPWLVWSAFFASWETSPSQFLSSIRLPFSIIFAFCAASLGLSAGNLTNVKLGVVAFLSLTVFCSSDFCCFLCWIFFSSIKKFGLCSSLLIAYCSTFAVLSVGDGCLYTAQFWTWN